MKPLVLIVSFLAGIAIFTFIPPSLPVLGLIISLIGALLVVYRLRGGMVTVLMLLFCTGIVLAGGRLLLAQPAPDPVLSLAIGEDVELIGTVVADPDVRDVMTQYTVNVRTVRYTRVIDARRETILDSIDGKVLVRTRQRLPVEFGDTVTVRGVLEVPEPFRTEYDREFAYDQYLAKDRIYFVVSFASVSIVQTAPTAQIPHALFTFKHAFTDTLNRHLPEPESSLAGGILLGLKQSLGDDLEEAFRRVGLIHIVVLSGYNITIIAVFFQWLLREVLRLSEATTFTLALIAICLFAFIVGFGATVARATLMGIIALFARYRSYQYDVTRALLVAAAVMVAINPWLLMYDLSFQLSFLATVGLLYLAPVLERIFLWIPRTFELRYIVSATFATQLFVLPVLLSEIGLVSFIAPLANIIILPFVPIMMLFSAATGFLGIVSDVLAAPFAWIAYLLLHGATQVSTFLADLPFAAIFLPPVPPWLTLLLYTVLALIFIVLTKRSDFRWSSN